MGPRKSQTKRPPTPTDTPSKQTTCSTTPTTPTTPATPTPSATPTTPTSQQQPPNQQLPAGTHAFFREAASTSSGRLRLCPVTLSGASAVHFGGGGIGSSPSSVASGQVYLVLGTSEKNCSRCSWQHTYFRIRLARPGGPAVAHPLCHALRHACGLSA